MSRRLRAASALIALLYAGAVTVIIWTAFKVDDNAQRIAEAEKRIERVEIANDSRGVDARSGDNDSPSGQPGPPPGGSPSEATPSSPPDGGSTISVPPICVTSICTPGINLP